MAATALGLKEIGGADPRNSPRRHQRSGCRLNPALAPSGRPRPIDCRPWLIRGRPVTTFLARICAFKCFDAFILIFPLYVVVFADAGLSPVQIGVCLTVWSATNFALQIPSGVIADRWSRRHVLAFAQSARAAGFIVWLLYPHFWGFLAGLMLWGVKSAFTSGTFEALLYDELKARDQATRYVRVIGQARAAQAVAVLAAAIGAALAAPYGYPVCIAAGLASTGAAMAAALNLPPAQRALLTHGREYLSDLRRGLPMAIGQPAVLGILVFSALVLAFGAALEEFWPIFGAKVGLARPVIALFVGAQNAIEAMVSLVAWRLAFLAIGSTPSSPSAAPCCSAPRRCSLRRRWRCWPSTAAFSRSSTSSSRAAFSSSSPPITGRRSGRSRA